MDLLKDGFVDDELVRCDRCGFCMSTCPTYQVMRDERAVARGRNELVRQVAGGRMDILEQLRDPLFDCLLCGACTEVCFGSVKTDELMVRARQAWHAEHGQPRVQRIIFDELLPHPARMTRLMRLLSMGKRHGLSGLAERLGMLGWLGPTVARADGLVETMPRRFLRDHLPAMGFVIEREGRHVARRLPARQDVRNSAPSVVFFIGCGTNYQVPAQGEAAIRLLAAAGCEVTILENCCCGLPPYSYGDREAAKRLAIRNLELLDGLSFDYLVTECGSCSSFLRKWPRLLAGESQAELAQRIADRVRDFTQIMVGLRLPEPVPSPSYTVTYHDPCHLARGLGVTEEPRKLLTDVGGFQVREMAEADWCCGGAGSYNLTHADLSAQILQRKTARIDETGADVVVTACPACVIQLDYGMRHAHGHKPVRHVAEVLCDTRQVQLLSENTGRITCADGECSRERAGSRRAHERADEVF